MRVKPRPRPVSNAVPLPSMTSLFARAGTFETRIGSGARAAHPAKRKRWTCPQCQLKGAQQRRRAVALDPRHRIYKDSVREEFSGREIPILKLYGAAVREGYTTDYSQPEPNKRRLDKVQDSGNQSSPSTTESLPYYTISRNSRLEADYRIDIPKALRWKDRDLLIRATIQASDDPDYIRSIPATTFSEVLALLDPQYFVVALRDVHEDISTAMASRLEVPPIQEIHDEFTGTIQRLVLTRKASGMKLGLIDYKQMLKCASAVGNAEVATTVWKEMQTDKIAPDTECYNYLLSAIVWNKHHRPEARQGLRITKWNLKWRAMESRGRPYIGLSHGRNWDYTGYKVGSGGIKDVMNSWFREMLYRDCLPTEETFTLLMEAYGREGDVKSVHNILRKVWNIDIVAIQKGRPTGLSAATSQTSSSTLSPSVGLLHTLARVFGMNNDIPTAMKLVDFVARNYDLKIPGTVWALLLEWTFVLSKSRSEKKMELSAKLGKLVMDSPEQLWNIMVSLPYNIRPTIPMYNRLIRHYARVPSQYPEVNNRMIEKIREGSALLLDTLREVRRAASSLARAKELAKRGLLTGSVEQFERKYQYLVLIKRRDHLIVRRWIRLFFWRRFLSGYESLPPKLLLSMLPLAPAHIRYQTETGWIEFAVRKPSSIESPEARYLRYSTNSPGYIEFNNQKEQPRELSQRQHRNMRRARRKKRWLRKNTALGSPANSAEKHQASRLPIQPRQLTITRRRRVHFRKLSSRRSGQRQESRQVSESI